MRSMIDSRFPLSFLGLLSHAWPGQQSPAVGVFLVLALLWTSCSSQTTSQPEPRSTSNTPAPTSSPTPSSQESTTGKEKSLGPLKLTVPAGWVEQTPTSSMRQAQFSLPKADGDSADGELVVFYFGPGQGGSVEANIDRWIGQIGQPDGSSSKDKAKTSKKVVSGFPVTIVDVSGTYQASMMPGSSERHNNPGYRMLAAVVESSEGPWFFKLVGPEKTIAKWSGSFDQFINSIQKA
jgi:hypothetical protein